MSVTRRYLFGQNPRLYQRQRFKDEIKKMIFFSGVTTEYPTELYRDLLHYRYRVFVEKLGWDVPTENGLEFDQFDREDTVHVVARDKQGSINGCSRLLPTNKPYLLAEVFPQLMAERSLPRCDETWEISRFTAQALDSDNAIKRNCFFSPAAVKLLSYSVAAAAGRGAKNLIFVASVGMETLLKRADFKIRRAGPSMTVHGHRVFACWIEI
jgi:acyl homoserine lactone synthase